MRNKLAIFSLLCLPLAGCEKGSALRVTSCAMTSESLAIAFHRPKQAAAGLKRLEQRVRAGDDEAIAIMLELMAEVRRCAEKA